MVSKTALLGTVSAYHHPKALTVSMEKPKKMWEKEGLFPWLCQIEVICRRVEFCAQINMWESGK